MSDDATQFLILGTAGHIDHGKTSLIRRLSGVETDRLPEEKKRGITIDLGFANLDLDGFRFGIVDVPGHERFVHNMVAGATGIDIAMLVVAADDSVMPQTVEHLAILELLGIQTGLVVVTKIDLVEEDHLELVREELAELLEETFLADAPIVSISSANGEGYDDLRTELARLARAFGSRTTGQVFRMPIDRVFTIKGHGTVVTGTVFSGTARVGENLWLMPTERSVRVRRIQSHKDDVSEVHAGQRAAINLAGIKHEEIRRGNELTVEGYLQSSRRLLAQVRLLPTVSRPLVNRQLLRLHVGTRDVTARVITREPIEPGSSGYIELRCREPVMADYGQRFILRQLSPVITVGGGVILDPVIAPYRRIRDLTKIGTQLVQPEPLDRLATYLEENDLTQLGPEEMASRLGIDPASRQSLIDRLLDEKRVVRLKASHECLMHVTRRKELGKQILKRCERELKRRQPSRSLERATILTICRRFAAPNVLEAMLDDLLFRNQMVRVGDKIGPAGLQAKLTKNQQRIQEALLASCQQGGLTPPTTSEVAKQQDCPLKEVEMLAKVAEEDELLVRIADGMYFDPDALAEARRRVVDHLKAEGSATVADLRGVWDVSRKFAVPLCEHFDAIGVTKRVGDARELGEQAELDGSPTDD